MFYQLFCSFVLLWSTNIYPSAIERIADDFLALGDELLYKVGGMEEGVFGYFSKGVLLDEIDTGIGIVVILRFLYETFDIAAIEIEDTKLDTDVVRNGSNRHLCIVHLEVEEEVLIVDVGEKVGVHHKDGIVVESIYELDAAYSTKELRFVESAYSYAIVRGGEVFFQLLSKIVDSHIDVLHSIRNEAIYIMVDDALASDFKKGLGSFFGKRTKTPVTLQSYL